MKPLGPTTDIGEVNLDVEYLNYNHWYWKTLDVEYYKLCNKLNLKKDILATNLC